MCSKQLKISFMALALLLLVLSPTYSLDEAEAQELTQILTELNSGLNKIESGLTEASTGQEKLEGELTVLHNKTKLLEGDLHKQKTELMKLEAQLQNLRDLYDEIETKNRLLRGLAIGASAMAVTAIVITVF